MNRMSQTRTVQRVVITVFVHATEDQLKIKKAVQNLFPPDIKIKSFEENHLKGYFGDPIILLKLVISNRRPATELFDNIITSLSSLDADYLINELEQRIDESRNLYIRLDKQKAFQEKITFNTHDSIRLKIKLHLPHKSNTVKMMEQYIQKKRAET